jgi:nicotinamidase/pyrazinamidase
MERGALLVVDMLEAFALGTKTLPPVVGLDKMAKRVKKLVDKAREIGVPVFYVNDCFMPAEAAIDKHMKLFGVHGIKGDPRAEVMKILKPRKMDFVIEKKMYDGFYDTRLDSILRELEVKNIVVVGAWTNACVQHTVMGGWARGYRPYVVEDCVMCPDEKEHGDSIKYMKKFYGIKLLPHEEVLTLLEEMK